jgi:integrase
MTRPHCTTAQKPAKPYREFPLFANSNGQWAKTIRGKKVCFGPWADPKAARVLYEKEKDDWEAGRNPRQIAPADYPVTVGEMVALTLDAKASLVETGEMKQGTYREYCRIGDRLKRVFGATTAVALLGPPDFARLKADFAAGHAITPRTPRHQPRVSKGHKSLASLKGDVRKTRVFFNYMVASRYLARPPAYGVFQVPTKKSFRLERRGKPKRKFSAEQVNALLKAATIPMQAICYLGINCAFGPTDCAVLRRTELDLDEGWVTFIRMKTGVKRRCPLWPETVAALRAALAARPQTTDPALDALVFVTARHNAWSDLSVCGEFKKVRDKAGLPKGTPGFYAFRHTFITQTRKQIADHDAIRTITGHVTDENDMLSSVYDEDWNDVEDNRLLPVTDYMHRWLKSSGAAARRTAARDVLPFAAQRSVS